MLGCLEGNFILSLSTINYRIIGEEIVYKGYGRKERFLMDDLRG
jgi:hypothetical protein